MSDVEHESFVCDWQPAGDGWWICPRAGCHRKVQVKHGGRPCDVECRASIRARQAIEKAARKSEQYVVNVERLLARKAEDAAMLAEAVGNLVEVTGEKSFIEKASCYARALARWAKAGFPVRSEEEVAAIVATCEACEKYDREMCTCEVCGCKVSAKGMAIKNKAKMATEHCPTPYKLW